MNNSKNTPALFNETGLTNPGDKASAYITPSGRQVLKVEKTRGNEVEKYSATRYPTTGTTHETRTVKQK
ncbi:MAG TPA: hypothetical protein PLF24_00685 [Ruminococcus sp.]|nr:hypothetical protein [Ruminococcus sp.]